MSDLLSGIMSLNLMPGCQENRPGFGDIAAQRDGVLELRRDREHAQKIGSLQWGRQPGALEGNIHTVRSVLVQASSDARSNEAVEESPPAK